MQVFLPPPRAPRLPDSLFKRPAALVPLAMSLAALLLVLGHALFVGVVPVVDHGAVDAFQLLLAGQVPLVVYFAARWLPRVPRAALRVLALQAGAVMLAIVSVVFLT